jgi:hypothetical protein
VRLSDAISHLTSAWEDWGGFLGNPNFARIDDVVAWKGYESRRTPHFMTILDFRELLRAKHYSFQVSADGSIVQLLYAFKGSGELLRAGLAYYAARPQMPEVSVVAELEDATESEVVPGAVPVAGVGVSGPDHEEGTEEFVGPLPDVESFEESRLPISWVRFDYDPSAERGVLHAAAHLQSSIGVDLRIPAVGVPTPRQWIEAIFAWFYPEDYKRHRLDEDGDFVNAGTLERVNREPLTVIDTEGVLSALHLAVPRGPRVRPAAVPAATPARPPGRRGRRRGG